MESVANQPIIRSSSVQLQKWVGDNKGGWAIVLAYLQDELNDTYKKLANVDTTPVVTEQLRGKATFIAKLLNLYKVPVPFSDPYNQGV